MWSIDMLILTPFASDSKSDTIQNWEQGRNRPDRATQLLLKAIEAYPHDVEAVLTNAESAMRPSERR